VGLVGRGSWGKKKGRLGASNQPRENISCVWGGWRTGFSGRRLGRDTRDDAGLGVRKGKLSNLSAVDNKRKKKGQKRFQRASWTNRRKYITGGYCWESA